MAATPSISVLFPFHNGADMLRDALESLVAQTWHDFEVVAIDDGSEDASPDIAADFAARDRRVRVVRSPRVGLVGALVAACTVARGPFLARMDADDVALPERFARQMALLCEDPALAVCGSRVRVTGPSVGSGRRRYERWINDVVTSEDITQNLFIECPIPHPTFLMRRAAFESVGGYQDHGWPEDYDLLMRFFTAGMRMGKAAEELLEWRDRPGRLSMRDARYSEAAFRALKRHYLFQTYLREGRRFVQWGAGEVGKRWLRTWEARCPETVVDVHPRKIGRKIHGFSVIAPDELPSPGEVFVVVAVGARNARAEIRAWLVSRGYEELRDFLFLA